MPGNSNDDRQRTSLDEETLAEIIRRVVAISEPERVIMFGSAARGEIGPDSDVDLLVVVGNGVHRRATAQSVYRGLIGVGFAADIVVVTLDDVERFQHQPGFILESALREGKLRYAR